MKHFLQKLGTFIEAGLGLSQLGTNFKKFAAMHCTYSIFQAMVSSYIITLLMRVTGNGDIVIWYNLATFLFQGCGVVLAVAVMRRGGINLAGRLAVFGFIILYSVLLFSMSSADRFMPLFGLLNGVSNGFYWLSYASYLTAFTEDSGRDAAQGVMGFINGVTILAMPALSGFLIETIGKAAGTFVGYTVVFGASFAVASCTILLSFRLPKQIGAPMASKTCFRKALREIAGDPCWRCGMACETLRGIRDGTFGFLLNLLLFETIQSETLIGINNLLASVGTIVSFWVAGRIIRPGNRVRFMLAGSVILLVACGFPAFSLGPATIMVFAVVNAFFSTFVINPSNSIMFLIVQRKSEPEMTNEYLAIRDVFLVAGRMIGVLILFVFPREQLGYVIAIVLLTLSQFIVVGLSWRSTKLLRRDEEAAAEYGV